MQIGEPQREIEVLPVTEPVTIPVPVEVPAQIPEPVY